MSGGVQWKFIAVLKAQGVTAAMHKKYPFSGNAGHLVQVRTLHNFKSTNLLNFRKTPINYAIE